MKTSHVTQSHFARNNSGSPFVKKQHQRLLKISYVRESRRSPAQCSQYIFKKRIRNLNKYQSRRYVVTRAIEEEAQSSAIDLYEQLASGSSSAVGPDVQKIAVDTVQGIAGDGVSVSDIVAGVDSTTLLTLAAVPVAGALAFSIVSSLQKSGPSITNMSASRAFSSISSPAVEQSVVFLDIRTKQEVRERGSPRINGRGVKTANVCYLTADKEGDLSVNEDFCESIISLVEKTGRKTGEVCIYLIDGYGNQSKTAAQSFAKYYTKEQKEASQPANVEATATVKIQVELPKVSIITINGGAESWKDSELPWDEPRPDIVSALLISVSKAQETFKSQPTLFGGLLAVGGIAAATSLFFAEVETAVEVIGGITLLNYVRI